MPNWHQTFGRPRREYRLITFDQRCHGKSFHGDFRFETLAQDVLGVADHLELAAPEEVGEVVAEQIDDEAAGFNSTPWRPTCCRTAPGTFARPVRTAIGWVVSNAR